MSRAAPTLSLYKMVAYTGTNSRLALQIGKILHAQVPERKWHKSILCSCEMSVMSERWRISEICLVRLRFVEIIGTKAASHLLSCSNTTLQIDACGDLLCSANRLDHPGLPRNNHNARNTGNPLNSRSSALAEVYTACSESVVTALILGWAVSSVTNRENEWTEREYKGRYK